VRRDPAIDPVVEPARVEAPVSEVDFVPATDSAAGADFELATASEVAKDFGLATDSASASGSELATASDVTADREPARDVPTAVEDAVAADADTRTSDVVAPRGSAAGRATRVSGASSSPTTARA
jgi:hypothetical protein